MNPGQHIFFQQFGFNPEPQHQLDPNYLWNSMLLELASNWAFVRWLMCRHRENLIEKIDPLEKDWLQFIVSNNIDVEKYQKDYNLFLEENLRSLS